MQKLSSALIQEIIFINPEICYWTEFKFHRMFHNQSIVPYMFSDESIKREIYTYVRN